MPPQRSRSKEDPFADAVHSPSTSTLLREPLLRGSAQRVSVRVTGLSASKDRLPKEPDLTSQNSTNSSPEQAGRAAPPTPWQLIMRMPREVYVVFLVDFLNSYRTFGFRSVQYQYLTNEFALSDMETGQLLGIQAWLLVIFGFLGAMMVDAFGVRRTALVALFVAAISRGMLTFGTSRQSMVIAIIGLSPFGEAVLSTGIYTVALKKLTTPETRSVAFGVQYGIFNLAGALADIAADFLRKSDFLLPKWIPYPEYVGGAVWSGLRLHVFVTWIAVLLAIGVAFFFLHDAVVVPLDVPISPFAYATGGGAAPSSPPSMTAEELREIRDNATVKQRERGYVVASIDRSKPKPPPPSMGPSPILGRANLKAMQQAASPRTWMKAAATGGGRALENTRDLCRLAAFWRALWLSVCLLFLSKQWGDLDQLLPPFLERHYGVNSPIYASASTRAKHAHLSRPQTTAQTHSHLHSLSPRSPLHQHVGLYDRAHHRRRPHLPLRCLLRDAPWLVVPSALAPMARVRSLTKRGHLLGLLDVCW